MIDVEFVIRNYRCFGDEPVHFRISDGFTALIGTNNSGKSSLLRMLYEFRPLISLLTVAGGNEGGNQPATALLSGGAGRFFGPTLLGGERVLRAGADRDLELSIIVRDGPNGQFALDGEQVVVDFAYSQEAITSSKIRLASGRILGTPVEPADIEKIGPAPFTSAMREFANTMYVGPFRNVINVGAQMAYYDIQTGDAFVRTFAGYKSGPDPRANEAVAQLLRELKRIFGFESLDINATPTADALQITVDDRSFRLTEQGAGLAHFIVVLVNAMFRRPSFLLIDEPELNLHASLQLDYLSTLAKYTKYGVVFATHSLGLARTSADRIYTLAKPKGGTSRAALYEADNELVTLLGQLSFDKRPGLGYSRVLLVEGKSELRAVAQFLRRYGKEHEVMLLPLHGDEMIGGDVQVELAELKRLGGKIHYLIDSERTKAGGPLAKRRQAFVDLCSKLDIEGLVLERRALENYLPERVVKVAFGDGAKALGPYEKKGAAQGWPKTGNWRAAAEMTLAELDATDLGQFLKGV